MPDDDVPPIVRLRPIEEGDLETLSRFGSDPSSMGEFEQRGFADPRTWRRRWDADGWISPDHAWLAVEAAEGALVGIVSWRDPHDGGQAGASYDLGAMMLAEHRGKGLGTAAQRALVAHLFSTTPVHRLHATTEAGNVAEQRALEKIGFVREGVLRQWLFRGGQWRDHVIYGLLRTDLPENAHDSGGSP
jgi:RimJ/RimL family protein N-acetyltransferase